MQKKEIDEVDNFIRELETTNEKIKEVIAETKQEPITFLKKLWNISNKHCEFEKSVESQQISNRPLIRKFSGLLGGLDASEEPMETDEVLKRDIKNIIWSIPPYLPYIGFLSGDITVCKHVSKHMLNKVTEEPKLESSLSEQ